MSNYREGVTAHAHRSRKFRYCGDEWAHDRNIQPGDVYVRAIAFPGHDANPDGPGPLTMILCAHCASRYPIAKAALGSQP